MRIPHPFVCGGGREGFNTGTGEITAPGMASPYGEWDCPERESFLSFRVRQQYHEMPGGPVQR